MKNATRIAQLTDCHLPADPKRTYRGVNPRDELESLLKRVVAFQPDLLLLTGDLSEDGSGVSYRDLQAYLKPLGVPLLALPGNHDDAVLLNECFPGSPVESLSISGHGAWQLIRLNSCMPGRPEGHLDEMVLTELDGFLKNNQNQPQLIALHHQPIAVGSPWIDKYPLLDPQRLLRIIDRYPGVKAVVWGHVHQAYDTDRNGTAMLGGPSSAINAKPGMQKFTPDPKGSAFRWLKLGNDNTISSGIM
ncbi:MAG: phosphodiesterase [Lysobacterales bacterium]